MLPTTSLVICLVVYIIGIEATRMKTFFGIKTKEYPKSSCKKIQHEISESECLRHCIDTTNTIVMISHDDSTNTCMCCSDITGDDITGPNWKSYVRRTGKYFFRINRLCKSFSAKKKFLIRLLLLLTCKVLTYI